MIEIVDMGLNEKETRVFFCETHAGGKFWSITRKDALTYEVSWGGAGCNKSHKTNGCTTIDTCVKEIKKLIKSKMKKGYEEW